MHSVRLGRDASSEARPACVQEKAQQNFAVSMGISAHEVTLEQLADEIAQVYVRCGFDRDATVSTLQMLTNIEVSQHTSCRLLFNAQSTLL